MDRENRNGTADQLQSVLLDELVAHLRELRLIADHDPEMPHALDLIHLENRKELMVAQFEKGVALTPAESVGD